MKHPRQSGWAFTLVELLVAVAVISVLSTVGYIAVTGVREGTASSKLEQDVAVLNNAIDSYMASGGSMDNVTTASAALAKLKTRATAASAARTLGATGSFVDPRTTLVLQNAAEAGTPVLRAYFTATPTPRFYTATAGPAGIKELALNEAAAAAAPATETREQTLAQNTESGWIWAYEDKAPPEEGAAAVPVATDYQTVFESGTTVITLDPPVISPAQGSRTILEYPLTLGISNPNPTGSSVIYYSLNGGPYVLFSTPFTIGPGAVTAVCVSLDKSRYADSAPAAATYGVTPIQLAVGLSAPTSLTYAQAGGSMIGEATQFAPSATVSLLTSGIASQYLNGLQFLHTTDGSDPLSSGTAVTNSGTSTSVAINLAVSNWGGNGSLNLRAAARAINTSYFISSAVSEATVVASPVVLPTPLISPTNQTVGSSVTVVMTNPATSGPTGANLVIRYTTNGVSPTVTNSIVYSAPFAFSSFAANEQKTATASAFPPSNYLTNWFTASATASRTYTGAANTGSGLPAGALVSLAELQNNVVFRGSMTIAAQATQTNMTFFGNSRIIGNLYVPGTPAVYKDHVASSQWDNQLWSATNDTSFTNYILGKQFDNNGNQVIPATEPASPRVINLNGSVNPTNYHILIQDSAKIEGKIFRRITPPSLPTVSNPGTKSNNVSRSYHSWTLDPTNPGRYSTTVDPTVNSGVTLTTNASLKLLPGNYGTVSASNNGRLVLGDAANPDTVQYYSFESLQVNGGAGIEVVGKVVVTIKYGSTMRVDNNGFFGNSAHPEWLQLNVYSTAAASASTQHVLIASTGAFYGQINAPKGLVTIQENTIFNGSVTAYKLQMTGSAGVNINFSLSPIAP
ncbi:MAG: type II secretion system protein [Chthoniobacterales bacterium]|nr:type II secretion system protein [Chthoniobacterales bacterium]